MSIIVRIIASKAAQKNVARRPQLDGLNPTVKIIARIGMIIAAVCYYDSAFILQTFFVWPLFTT